jgi:hypothetical protein
MHAVDAGGGTRAGAAAYAAIFRAMIWAAPLGWLLSVPPASVAARRVYAAVAERRRRDGACGDASCAVDAPVPPAPPFAQLPRWVPERHILAAFVAFWLVSVAVIALASPFHRIYLPLSHETHERLEGFGDRWRQVVYPWTGFAAHGVFMDGHFARYDRQLMLVQRGPGGEREIPLTRADGTSGAWGWGREWAHWIFRTAAPTLPRPYREAGLRRWADFWFADGGDPRGGAIVVRERSVDVSLGKWRDGLAERNRAREWRDVARITGEPGALRVEWLARPHAALVEP